MTKILSLPCLILFLASYACAGDVKLAWDQSVTPGVTHNKVYYGSSPRSYDESVVIEAAEEYTVADLPSGVYYFAVTALDKIGTESSYSNEVSTTVRDPVAAPINLRIPD